MKLRNIFKKKENIQSNEEDNQLKDYFDKAYNFEKGKQLNRRLSVVDKMLKNMKSINVIELCQYTEFVGYHVELRIENIELINQIKIMLSDYYTKEKEQIEKEIKEL